MNAPVHVSIDLEADLGQPYSVHGLRDGLPRIMKALHDRSVPVSLFVAGDVAREAYEIASQWLSAEVALGSHGMGHSTSYYSHLSRAKQTQLIRRSVERISDAGWDTVEAFRAPNFGADSRTLAALRDCHLSTDSSVLPGRLVRRWRVLRSLDHRGAPRGTYEPDLNSIRRAGRSGLLEIPVTENPHSPGGPIGLGFLNFAGLETTMSAIEVVMEPYAMFLIHPWEAVQLSDRKPGLPSWVQRGCSGRVASFEKLLDEIGAARGWVSWHELRSSSRFRAAL